MIDRNDRPRVLHVLTRFTKSGGSEKNTLNTIAFTAERFAVDLAVGNESEMDVVGGLRLPCGGAVHILRNLDNTLHPLRNPAGIVELALLLRRNRYDIIHTHQAKAGLVGRIAALAARTPIVVHNFHAANFAHPRMRPKRKFVYAVLERLMALRTDYYVSVGEELMQHFLNHGVGHASQYRIIRSGFDTRPFEETRTYPAEQRRAIRAELGVDNDTILVGKVAVLEKRKGHIFALDAARQILAFHGERRRIKFAFVGDGHDRGIVEEETRRLGLTDNVLFTAYRTDVHRVFAALDIQMHTSLQEGLPQVFVQGALAAKPIVTFAIDGAREVIADGESGFVVPLGDTAAMAERIARLIDNKELAAAMGEAAVKRVGDKWTLERMRADVTALYGEIDERLKRRRVRR